MMKHSWKYYKPKEGQTGAIYRTDGICLEIYTDAFDSDNKSWWPLMSSQMMDIRIKERQLIELVNDEAFLELL